MGDAGIREKHQRKSDPQTRIKNEWKSFPLSRAKATNELLSKIIRPEREDKPGNDIIIFM
jgi:hypothetical protein